MTIRGGVWWLLLAGTAMGQSSSNATLNGKYYFRHLQITTDTANHITDIRSLWGAMTFDGSGHESFTGRSAVGTTAPVSASGSGAYSVDAGGFVTLPNPQNSGLTLNARWGESAPGATQSSAPAEAMLVGSSTDGAGNVFDLFVAIQAPAAAASDQSLSPGYNVATLSFPSGADSQVRSALFSLQGNAIGTFVSIGINGHAANVSAGAPVMQTLTGGTYSMQADGSAAASFPLQSGLTNTTQLLSGNKTIYVSTSGSVILGGCNDGTQQDILVGFKTGNGRTWANETYWQAGLRFESGGSTSAYSGSLFAGSTGSLIFTRREHQWQESGAVAYDFTGTNAYTLAADGTGTAGLTNIALGAAVTQAGADSNGFVGTEYNRQDTPGYEVSVGVRTPTQSAGSAPFLDPDRVVNAGSFAPAGNPIAPGEFVTLFGSNLAPGQHIAQPPYPPALGGVTVTINGVQAPLYFVSAGQINALVPYATTGPKATIIVSNNQAASNSIEVPVAATAPGIFTMNQNGVGPGAILHKDFTLVSTAHPAKPGETVLVYLTGLGAVNPPVADGTAGSGNPLSKAVATPDVFIGGIQAAVAYAGLAPLYPGLYQMNVTVPSDLAVTATGAFPLAVRTPDSFHDQVDLIVGP